MRAGTGHEVDNARETVRIPYHCVMNTNVVKAVGSILSLFGFKRVDNDCCGFSSEAWPDCRVVMW